MAYYSSITLGQKNIYEITAYSPTRGDSLYNPCGVYIDRTTSPDLMYVLDTGHNRVLVYNWTDLTTWQSSTPTPIYVLGQSNDATTSTADGDSNFTTFPTLHVGSATTIASLDPDIISPAEAGGGSAIATDSSGNVWICDFYNHRALRYPRGSYTADAVLGQSNFVNNSVNRGGSVANNTLGFSWSADGNNNTFAAGIMVDQVTGAIWICDSYNHRILCFQPGSSTANIVLGQPDFTTRTPGTALNKLKGPTALTFSSDRKKLYVADPSNNRVLKYTSSTAGFSTADIGATATLFGAPTWDKPMTIDVDPTHSNRIWITDTGADYAYLLNESDGSEVANTRLGNGDANYFGDNEGVGGSLGFDAVGNIFATEQRGANSGEVLYFPKSGEGTLPRLPTKLFSQTASISQLGFNVINCMESANDQLIVGDYGRCMFWNNLELLSTGKPADGYITELHSGVASNFTTLDTNVNDYYSMAADKNNHLWITVNNGIMCYSLPLTTGQTPSLRITSTISILGGGTLSPYGNWGIAVNSDSSEIWLTQKLSNRAMRIRNPLTSPLVDVILGQNSTSGTSNSSASTGMSAPGGINFDTLGNLYVSDHSLETSGNQRILVFYPSTIPSGNAAILLGPTPDKIFPSVATWQPAFGPNNEMVVGYNRYLNAPYPSGGASYPGAFPGIYLDPLGASTTPDDFLGDFYSMATAATFDSNWNLYVADHNRNLVRKYERPFMPEHMAILVRRKLVV